MQGRLNTFQLSMLQWNDLHPYNAIHVVRIPEAIDFERLKTAIHTTLEAKGLTGLAIDRRTRGYHYFGGPSSAEIRLADPDTRSALGFEKEIERQLNTPFAPAGRFSPFRFFVYSVPGRFSLGLVYFHPVADAESIVSLLREIMDVYRDNRVPAGDASIERYPLPPDNLLRHNPRVLLNKLASLPGSIRNMRTTCRPSYRDSGDFATRFTCFSIDRQTLSGMMQTAKSWNVTLNDLFLALLMKAVALLAPDRAGAGRRTNLSLGCIVNTRRDLGLDGRRQFGLFLGSFVVHHAVPAGISLADLASDIGRQTLVIKQKRLYLGSSLELTFGRLMMSLFSAQRRRKLYQKHYPLWGGLTNMNLNSVWPQPEEIRPVDYFRAVSTGPVTPLVASITTIGPVANIGLSYRATVFGAPDIERVKACFLDPLGPLAHP